MDEQLASSAQQLAKRPEDKPGKKLLVSPCRIASVVELGSSGDELLLIGKSRGCWSSPEHKGALLPSSTNDGHPSEVCFRLCWLKGERLRLTELTCDAIAILATSRQPHFASGEGPNRVELWTRCRYCSVLKRRWADHCIAA